MARRGVSLRPRDGAGGVCALLGGMHGVRVVVVSFSLVLIVACGGLVCLLALIDVSEMKIGLFGAGPS